MNWRVGLLLYQFNDDKQKFKDETELECAQYKFVLH